MPLPLGPPQMCTLTIPTSSTVPGTDAKSWLGVKPDRGGGVA